MPGNESAVHRIPTLSSTSTAAEANTTSLRWIVYSAEGDTSSSPRKAISADTGYHTTTYSIPSALKQDAQEASICFFFRHYGGTAIDPEVRNGFNQLWQPMYLQSSAQSTLRLATAAVTVKITMMWSSNGCDTRLATSLFTQAVAAAREALHDPLQSSTDEILMTILVFDLYDALVLHYGPGTLEYGKHKHGALAMIEHRAFGNLKTSRGRALIGAVRHSLLPYMLSSRKGFPEQSDYLFDHPSLNDTKASILDLISVQLSRVQSRLWILRREDRLDTSLEERRTCYKDIIAEALQIEGFLLGWNASLNGDWLPEYISRGSVIDSIQDAGFYGTRCIVWPDLTIGSIWILFCIRYLLVLQVIRQCFADESSLLIDPGQRTLLFKAEKRSQDLVDFICETIPFYLGDAIVPKNPMYSTSINFPFSLLTDITTGTDTRVPSSGTNHQKRAAASGGWILFPHLVNVWRLADPEDDAVPIVLREGQLDWIKEQVKRLQKIFLFCDPVWFKRGTTEPSSS
ncbi:MAG: hypothetical protein LQ352_007529 [Teloschistes flavicans]|nr:MAG: hypothetical protein LQ352_007529 [Teloschistes flavicans]